MNRYNDYKKIFSSVHPPFAYVDMNLLDINIDSVIKRSGSKKIRIATKSIRSIEMLKYIQKKLGESFNGYMCFSAEEAVWLSESGLDNLLVAYPSLDIESLKKISKLSQNGKKIYLMVDSVEHINFLNNLETEGNLSLCLDLDLSTYFPGLNFGVFRSPLRESDDFDKLVDIITESQRLDIKGLMGYEAQIAGVTDNQSNRGIMNFVISLLKKISLRKIPKIREKYLKRLEEENISLDFVNGGGTGSMESTREELGVTEIAVGSGFYAPGLFDSYKNFRHEPAAGFALEVVRRPKANIYTCFAGGYVASGSCGIDKVPKPYLPQNCSLIKNEMAGEVQTPVIYTGPEEIKIGSQIYFRHAKAGELCERFNDLVLIKDGVIESEVKTYRGDGKSFG